MLNEEQINRLYKFCVQHYVRYYDVQIELVDHLANAIEAKMDADKNLDFETTLNSVYAGFGRMGFSKIISQKTEAASRQIRKRNWNYFKEYFTVPKIAVTILFISVFTFLYFEVNKNNLKILVGATVIFFMLAVILSIIFYFRAYKKTKKELLCLKYSNVFQPLGIVCQLPNFLNLFFFGKKDIYDNLTQHPVYYFLFVIIFVALLLLSFASLKTYREIQENARKNYPLAFE
ncbi:hypothetical protein A9P82_06345 [Arachidicoccus ginsenosidimutans]|uniref:hypothetical protein n=1 Tax=Arachidicoccus sp. BS20 TaxID=1850526 RepID=UPI0007F09E95|nr:hypothetical protein [Arachidicoccus sp. BS20]ANI88948.1 hypothetical protein A9P82_06345 [Arachidicoccus sp. BS20]